MPIFDYQALDAAGKKKRGSLNADSEKQARRLLREQNLYPQSLSVAGESESAVVSTQKRDAKPLRRQVISQSQLAMVLRQLGVLVNSGLPLDSALRMTVEQAESERERRLCQAWRSEIAEGRSFSAAMRRAPYRIPDSVIASVGVGEETGHLHQILLRMADEIESGDENRKTFSRGLIYPGILIVASIVVTVVMMTLVVPSLSEVFQNQDLELPAITLVVMGLSDFTRSYGIYLFLFLLALVIGLQLALKAPAFRLAWHARLLKVPGLGKWIRLADLSDWSRSLGTLLQSGVPALAALGIASTLVKNLYLRNKFESVTEAVRRGGSLHRALREANLESGFLVHMVGSGEASSELAEMLLRVGDFYRNRLNVAVETFLKLMNPALIIVIGAIILTVVMSIMLPILALTEQVN